MKKACSILLAAMALFSGASCTLETPDNHGHISLTLSTGMLQTKAGNGNVADGGGIAVDEYGEPDIVIAIVDRNNNIVAWYPEGYGAVAGGDYSSDCSTDHPASTPVTETTILFNGPTRGTYTVFAVANTAGLLAVGSPALSSAATLSDLQNLVLSVVSGTPTFNSAMPLSATGTLTVTGESGREAGQIDLSLKRVVARVSLTFKNLTENALTLHNCTVTLHAMNPSRGFLFEQATDYVSGYDRDLDWPASEITVPVINPEDPESVNTSSLVSKLVFPSVAPLHQMGRRYLCDISFRIVKSGQTYDSNDSDTYDDHSFTNLPVHDRRSADILALSRNQDLQIETTISKKIDDDDISFNFEVTGWDKLDEFVVFH